MSRTVVETDDIGLAELLDRVVEKGVVLGGDITISVAGVDLIYVSLRVLIRAAILEATENGTMAGSPAKGGSDVWDHLRVRSNES